MAKERIAYIDFMKGLCIILVVSFHINHSVLGQHTNDMLQQFRIPMYFFLSGLFFKTYNGLSDFVRKKVNNIVIPLIFFLLIGATYVFCREFFLSKYNVVVALSKLPLNPIDLNTPMWFLVVLFEVNVIYYLLQQFLPRLWANVAAIALSAIGYFIVLNGYNLILYLDIALVALPYFILGSEAKRMGYLLKGPSLPLRLIMAVGVFVLLWFFASEINMKHRVYPDYFRLYALPAVAIMTLLFLSQYIKRPVPIISYVGRYSLIVLGTHYYIIAPVKAVVNHFLGQPFTIWHLLITLTISILIEIPIIHILKTYTPYLTAQKEMFTAGWKPVWSSQPKS